MREGRKARKDGNENKQENHDDGNYLFKMFDHGQKKKARVKVRTEWNPDREKR